MRYFLRICTLTILFSYPVFATEDKTKKTCDYIKKPKINVNINLTIPEVTYDYTRSSKEILDENFEQTVEWLQKESVKSVGTARRDRELINIKGLTTGGYEVSMTGLGHARHVDRYGVYYCPFLTDINIELFYASKIYIAKDLPRGSCEFEETVKYELQHHNANVKEVQDYSQRLKKDLPLIVREIEESHGYVDASKIQETYGKIEVSVNEIIQIYYDTIWKNSIKRSTQIDTPEGYANFQKAIQDCKENRE